MKKDNELNQAEELTKCLDSLNENKYPTFQDEEIKKLVDLAAFVKQSYRQENLPHVLIDEIVNHLAKEFQEKKQKKSYFWLYSGIAGTVAAIFIAAFAHFLLPQPTDYNIAQQITPAADQPSHPISKESTDTLIPPQAQSDNAIKVPVAAPIEEKSTASVSKAIAEIIKAAESPAIDPKSNQVAILQEKSPTDIMMQKKVSMNKTSMDSLQEDKGTQGRKIARVMVMPNQAVQPTQVDTVSGDIKHVYNIGTHDEITITQGLADKSRVTSKEDPKEDEVTTLTEGRVIQPLPEKTKDAMNSLTVKVDHYNVIIEGNKTPEELQEIAESLVEKEVEQ